MPLRLTADGPTEVRLPGGRVVIRVQDGEGRALKSVAYVDHVRVALDGREHSLGALPAGTHTVIVGAEGHVGGVRTIRLEANQTRTLEFRLSPR
jgi:hypothetical protein